MKIAIHHRKNSFSSKWINYCKENDIQYKIVNCYDNDIIQQLDDCDAVMWHFHQASRKDKLLAKQLIYSLQTQGKKVFPDFNTCWHFDDKLGQKYLLEALGVPMPQTYVFFDKKSALNWALKADYPKVFKLRSGAGSANVRLVKNYKAARRYINRAFGNGFSQYAPWSNLQERWRKYRIGHANLTYVMKGVLRFGYTTEYNKLSANERGYVYFQDFIAGNAHDIRVTYVNGRCFAVRRSVRNSDFRASGSGIIDYDLSQIPQAVLSESFRIAEKLNLQTVAFDFILDNDQPMLVELSYGFGHDGIPLKMGYWNSDLIFHEEEFDPYGWMVESLVTSMNSHLKM